MKRIKIIDLLNMISKGEEVPNEIEYRGERYIFYGVNYTTPLEHNALHRQIDLSYNLNDEVKIIDEEDEFNEEDEFIDIEEFKSFITNVGAVNESNIEEYIHILFKQQTALITNQKKIINKLKEEGK